MAFRPIPPPPIAPLRVSGVPVQPKPANAARLAAPVPPAPQPFAGKAPRLVAPVPPPPLRAGTALQSKPAVPPPVTAGSAVQMAECTCGKPGNKHKSDCPRNPNRLRTQRNKKKVQHNKTKSYKNVVTYQSNWSKKQGVTQNDVNQYISDTGGSVSGHRTSKANKNKGMQGTTKQDLKKFQKWKKDN